MTCRRAHSESPKDTSQTGLRRTSEHPSLTIQQEKELDLWARRLDYNLTDDPIPEDEPYLIHRVPSMMKRKLARGLLFCSKQRSIEMRCWEWNCPGCNLTMRLNVAEAIRRLQDKTEAKLRFVTLTADPRRCTGEADADANMILAAFKKFGRWLGKGTGIQWIRVLETQKNGNPHIHMVVSKGIDKRTLAEKWAKAGGGFVQIRFVDDPRATGLYMTKEFMTTRYSRVKLVSISHGVKLRLRELNGSDLYYAGAWA